MSTRNRILDLLKGHPDGLDDDVVAERLSLPQRQQANSRCRELAREGVVERRSVGGKIRNFLVSGATPSDIRVPIESPKPKAEPGKPWFWEGNVVRTVTSHLRGLGWIIESTANTETGESGADIRARREEHILIVEVKGYPSKVYERGPRMGHPKRTNPPTQARHWLAEAILTALLRQSEGPEHHVAIAFPDFAVYTKLLTRISQSLATIGVIVLMVRESGTVVVVQDGNQIVGQGRPA